LIYVTNSLANFLDTTKRGRMKKRDVTPGMIVKLDPKQWSKFINTDKVGIVMEMPFPKRHFSVRVKFTDGTEDWYAPRHLREVS